MNQSTKCCRTVEIPGVPGTRGIRIGDRIAPVFISKSARAAGRF